MECLDEQGSGIRGQIMGKDKDCPLFASPTTADHMASMSDTLQTLFDALHQTLVYLGLAVRWEQDPSSSKSNIWDLLPGAPLHNALPIFALR